MNHSEQSVSESTGSIIGYFSRHRVAANLIMLLILILGIGAIFSLQVQFFPDLTSNRVTVTVPWPGANAEDVERQITNPLESRIKQLDGVDTYYSYSENGLSRLWIHMSFSADMSEMEQKIKTIVEGYSDYPADSQDPIVSIQEFSEMTSVIVLYSDGPVDDLVPYVDTFKTELLNRGIADIQVSGLRDTEIRVELETETLLSLNSNVNQLADRIRMLNQDHSAGTVGQSFSEKSVKSELKYDSPMSLANLIVQSDQQGNFTTLGQIAQVNRYDVDGTTKVFWKSVV